MNERTLPDDFSRWPADPFELLGVPPNANDSDLRKAYAQLIRIYKPEHFPDQFRRIREAYEAARHYAHFFTASNPPADLPAHAAESPPAAQPMSATPKPSDPGTQSAEAALRAAPRPFDEELDEAWNWAIDGDEARAFALLLELQTRYPDRTETYLRLYSLLSVAPELDTQRTPCDFLVQGLRRNQGSGPCQELYRREIEDNPGEALTERFAELLSTMTQPELIATFVRWRWSAAGRQKRFEVIRDDLAGLRAWLAVDQEETWLRLLASAADQLAWAPTSIYALCFMECLHEASRHVHLQLRCVDVFDRLEDLERVWGQWNSLMNNDRVPAQFLELLARFWTRPFSKMRRSVMALLADVRAETDRWLKCLDIVNDRSPALLSHFDRMLDSYEWTLSRTVDDRQPEALAEVSRHFLIEYGHDDATLRGRLLAFCRRERIHPQVVPQLTLSQPKALADARLTEVCNDWPLRFVYRACTLL